MWIKICGLSSKEAIDKAVSSGATHIGFVFAKSKRQVSVEEAKILAQSVPKNIQKVGLFVNAPIDEVEKIVSDVNLDMIQLHGDESAEYASQLSKPVIKAIKVIEGKLPENISDYKNSIILLDAPASQFAGGNGESFDWENVDINKLSDYQFFVAGGLNASNVNRAIQIFNPTGVDVSSGVETNGVKDLLKIKEFIKKVEESNV